MGEKKKPQRLSEERQGPAKRSWKSAITMGMVDVARLVTSVPTVLSWTITSTFFESSPRPMPALDHNRRSLIAIRSPRRVLRNTRHRVAPAGTASLACFRATNRQAGRRYGGVQ